MTNKEEIEFLTHEKKLMLKKCSDVIEAYNMAIHALEVRGEPMMVTGLGHGMHGSYIGYCPVCGRIVDFAQRFCHNCTQSLEWPVEEILANSKDDDE